MHSSLLSLIIGLRFCYGRWYDKFASLGFLVSISSIALGNAVLIIALSAINGFEYELNNRILAVVPHGEIESINQPWYNWNISIEKIRKIPAIIAAAPYVNFTGLIKNKMTICTIQIRGINSREEEKVSDIPKFIHGNSWINFRSGHQEIIIGKSLANKLKIRLNDWVSILLPNFKVKPNDKLRKLKHIRLHVTGIFQLNGQLDHNFAIVPLSDAQHYLDIGNSITGISIKVDNIFKAKKVVHEAGNKASKRYVYVKNWIETYGYMYRDIQIVKAMVYIAMIFVIGVACFNIISILLTVVKEKSSDIAVLHTLGAKNSLIHTIFVWYGLLVGMSGCLLGVLFGVILSLKLTVISTKIEKIIGYQLLSKNIYFIDFLPSKLILADIIHVVIITMLLSLLATWYPAYKAKRIEPAVILRNQN